MNFRFALYSITHLAITSLFASAQAQELIAPVSIEDEFYDDSAPQFFPKAVEQNAFRFQLLTAGATNGFTIDNTDRNSVVAGYHLHYLASESYTTNINWTGDVSTCSEGTVSSDFQDDTLRRINYYRAQVGLPADIYFDATKNAKCQEAALIFSREGGLSHDPIIDFPANPCLTADGDEAAGASNISLGSYGAGSIDRLMIDSGSNNAAVGHRRWLLYPRAQEMGNGSIPPGSGFPSSNSVWVIGNFKAPQPAQAIAWPNEGYIPYDLIPNQSESHPRWSFSYPGANFSNATITMSQGGNSISLVKESVSNGFGDNTVVWRPSGISSTAPATDITYSVTISNITGAPQSSYSYDVIAIDPFKLNDEVTISGSTTPIVGQASTYNFTPINSAESYELLTATSSAANWLEGAEDNPVPQVIDGTSNSYTLTTSALSATGSKSFHLTIPVSSITEESFEIDRDLIPSGSSELVFKNRFRFVTTASNLNAEISTDDGQSWTALWTRFGDANSSSGTSATWETSWQNVTVPIPAIYTDQLIRLRFRFVRGNSFFLGSSTNVGAFVEDIELTNSQELSNPTTSTIAAGMSSFDFTPASTTSYILAIRPTLGAHQFGYGPLFNATGTALPAPVITSSNTAEGAQGQVFSYTITADNSPASYNATGLPAGLGIDTVSGTISGNISPGVYNGITISATNASGTGNGPLTITILSGYAHYISVHYPGLGAPLDDDDNDSLANLMEVAIDNLNPNSGDTSALPQLIDTGITFQLTVNKSGIAGVDYAIEGTGDLVNGPWTGNNLTSLTDDANELTVAYDKSSGLPYFFRITVTENNDPTP